MNPIYPLHLTLRRKELHDVLTRLRPLDVVILLDLTVHALPRGGRLWSTIERIASELGFSEELVRETIDRLLDRGLLTMIPSRPPLLSLEVQTLLVREGEAPENIPLEPVTV